MGFSFHKSKTFVLIFELSSIKVSSGAFNYYVYAGVSRITTGLMHSAFPFSAFNFFSNLTVDIETLMR